MADIYERQYVEGVNWQDLPDMVTPLDAEHLNTLDAGMAAVDAELSAAIAYLVGLMKQKGLWNGSI